MRNILPLLILCFSLATADELIDRSAGEISNILVTIFWFDTLAELREYVEEELEDDPERLRGYSLIERYTDRDFCHMDMFAVRPVVVDGEHTLSIGHEVVHCVYGVEYHEEVE